MNGDGFWSISDISFLRFRSSLLYYLENADKKKLYGSQIYQITKLYIFKLYLESNKITKILESRLDGTYTRMLRAALNLSKRQHLTKQ